jgi:hypothetical protein
LRQAEEVKAGGYGVIKGKLNDWTCKEDSKIWFDFDFGVL